MKKINRQKIIRKLAIIVPLILIALAIIIFAFRSQIKAEISDPPAIVTQTGLTYKSTLDNLDLKMDVSYNSQNNHAPIILVLHGYSGPFTGTDIIKRLAEKGTFAIKTYKRGFNGSQGTSDDSARETHDFVDAVKYVKANFSQYVDPENINVVGYSGGGGNTYSLLGKFPDYFRSAAIFFGMSDYGYDDTYGWYNNGAGTGKSYRPTLDSRIGGSPSDVLENYHARDMALAAKNNPYTKIDLFYDKDEKICPVTHADQYIKNAAGFTNITSHISDSNTYTRELWETFTSTPQNWLLIGNDNMTLKQTKGFLYWTTKGGASEGIYSDKFQSLRNYKSSDNLLAKFDFRVYSAQEKSATLFGFRNSSDTTLKNSLGVLVTPVNSKVRLYLRADYDSTPLTAGNRELKLFNTSLTLGKTYNLTIELKNKTLTANLKDDGSVNETVTLAINQTKPLKEVNSFAISSYNNKTNAQMNGRIDNLRVYTYTRWIHSYPQEGSSVGGENNIVAENYFIPDIVAGKYPAPVLNNSGSMFIPGYIVTKPFEIILDKGQTKAGELEYNISGDGQTPGTAKIFKVKTLSGSVNLSLTVRRLNPNTNYVVEKIMPDGSVQKQTITSDNAGNILITGSVKSSRTFKIYLESQVQPAQAPKISPTPSPEVSPTETPTAGPTESVLSWY